MYMAGGSIWLYDSSPKTSYSGARFWDGADVYGFPKRGGHKSTPIDYDPYHEDFQKGAPDFWKPPYRRGKTPRNSVIQDIVFGRLTPTCSWLAGGLLSSQLPGPPK